MNWYFEPYTLPMLMAAAVSVALAAIGWRRRPASGATSFAVFMLAAAWWSLGYALEIGSAGLPAKVFWSKVQYLGISAAPVAWLTFTLEYTGRQRWLTRRNLLLLAIVPCFIQVAVWTNDFHELVWQDITLDTGGLFAHMAFAPGPLYLLNVTYGYVVFLVATVLILRAFARAPLFYRKQTGVLLIGALIPWIGNVLYMTSLNPWPGLDLTPVFFSVTGGVAVWGLFRFRLLDIVPIARDVVFESLSDAAIVLDPQNRVVDLNPAAQAIVGHTASDAVGQTVDRVFPDQADLVEQYKDVEEARTEIMRGEGPDRRHFDLRISPLRNRQGHLTGRLILLRDITERKQAEEQLRNLSRAVEQSANIVMITDTRGHIDYVNPKFTQLTGYTREEVIGQNPRVLKSGKTPSEEYQRLWETIAAGGEWRGEFLNRKKNGDLYWESASISAIKGAHGNITHYLAVKEDITARKQAEEALQNTNERLAVLVQAHAELNSRLDVEYVLSMAMDTAMRLTAADAGFIGLAADGGVRVAQTLGGYPPAIINTVLPASGGVVARAMQEQGAFLVSDVVPEPDNMAVLPTTRAQLVVPIWSDQRFAGILNLETSKPERFTAQLLDFLKLLGLSTAIALENAQLYEKRVLLTEELEAFAHTVAHDLKNPLNALVGYADFMQDHFMQLPAERRREQLQVIARNARKMANIIDELLLLAGVRKMEQVEMRPLEMTRIVAGARQRLVDMIAEYQAELDVPATWPTALGYAPWVEEVWVNYLSNALKYGGRPPSLTLGADLQESGQVRFWVRDDGPGIAPDKQALLFKPFTRLGQVRQVEGYGLGLSIVRRIVDRLGGDVGVESAPGGGSVFSFTLPGVETEVVTALPAPSEAAPM